MKKQFSFRHTELVTEKVEVVTTITTDTYEEAIVLLSKEVDNSDLNNHVKTLVSEEEQTRIYEKYEKKAHLHIDSEKSSLEVFDSFDVTFPVLKGVRENYTNIDYQYKDYLNSTFTYPEDESESI